MARLILEHCDVLQQMPIRIAKVDRGRRHPGEHDGLVSWFPVKIKRRDADRAERPRCGDDILEGCCKGDVSGRLLRTDIDFPQSEHRLAARTDPEKRRPACRNNVGQFEPEAVSIERDRDIEVCDDEVRLEQAVHGGGRGHRFTRLRSWKCESHASRANGPDPPRASVARAAM